MRLLIVKTLNNTFKCAYNSDLERLKSIKVGKILDCTIKQPRNPLFHRKFFALMQLVFQNQETYSNLDHLRHDLTVAAGFYEKWVTFDGEEKTRAKSISFSSMTAEEFKELYDKVLDVIADIYKWEKQEIIEQLQNFM